MLQATKPQLDLLVGEESSVCWLFHRSRRPVLKALASETREQIQAPEKVTLAKCSSKCSIGADPLRELIFNYVHLIQVQAFQQQCRPFLASSLAANAISLSRVTTNLTEHFTIYELQDQAINEFCVVGNDDPRISRL